MDNIVSLKGMIDQITNDVKHNMTYIHSDGELERFRNYYEDELLYEEIACINKYSIKSYGDDKKVSDNVKASLIASGISKDGHLASKEKFSTLTAQLNMSNLLFAKKRAQELEKDYLGNDFSYKVLELANEVNSHESIINPSELLKIGVCMQDRMSGYVEDHSGYNDSYISCAQKAWYTEKQKCIKEGLTDKAYYKILKDVFETDKLKHYTLIHRNALEKAADITYRRDNDIPVANFDMEELYKFNNALSVFNEDILEKYGIKENHVNKKIRNKIKMKTR